MTHEEKAKAYDKALERARVYFENENYIEMADVFPELKESEDERIRKAISYAIANATHANNTLIYGVTQDEAYSWLEKQKKPIPIPDKFSGLKSLLLQYLQSAANRKDDVEIEDDTDLWGRKILDYVWKYSDEQKEQKPILKFKVGDKIHLIDGTSPNYEDDCITIREIGTVNYIGEFKEGYVPIKEQNKWELVKEQKPVPKFSVGNYVKDTNYKGEPLYQIVGIDKECYICEYRGDKEMGDRAVMHFAFDNPYLRLEQKPKFNVGDTIRLKNSYAEYAIEGISDGRYYCKGCSIDIDSGNRDYELVRHKPAEELFDKEKMIKGIIDGITNLAATSNYGDSITFGGFNWKDCVAYLKKLDSENTKKYTFADMQESYKMGHIQGEEVGREKMMIEIQRNHNGEEWINPDDFTAHIRQAYQDGFREGVDSVKTAEMDNEETELSYFESVLFSAFSNGWQQYLHGEEVDVAQWAKEHSAELLNAAKLELKPAEWNKEDESILKEIVSFFKDGTVKLQHDLDLYAGFLENKFKSLRLQQKQE